MRRLAQRNTAVRSLQTLLTAAALLGSCYDTPLIADDESTAAAGDGAESSGGSGAGEGGSPVASAGKKSDTLAGSPGAGNSQAGSAGKPSVGAGGRVSSGNAGEVGQAGEFASPRVSWLDITRDQAPASSKLNAELRIQGYFYAYSDGCAEVDWDPQSRCVSGKLCDPFVTPEAWGLAIGFDFSNTGESGTPANAKLTWNPHDVGALGVAWRVTGEAPNLQVWALNMDPSWGGQCDIMSCEIAGPPDGVDVASLEGELLFGQMVKDDWGGSGVRYAFDAAAVHALQFKLPAIRAHAAKFDFCLEALGVIR